MTTELIVAIFAAIFASTGFWSFLSSRFQRKDKKQDATETLESKDKEIEGEIDDLKKAVDAIKAQNTLQSEMLRGIGHDRIIFLGGSVIFAKSTSPQRNMKTSMTICTTLTTL